MSVRGAKEQPDKQDERAGDLKSRPHGRWMNCHRARMLLGKTAVDAFTFLTSVWPIAVKTGHYSS